MNNKQKILFLNLLLIVLTFAIYSISLNYKILDAWDDQLYILNNTSKLAFCFSNIFYWFTHSCVGCYLPITMFSYMFDYNLFGLNSTAYHTQNLFWHIAAVLAVFNIFIKLDIDESISFLICLIFAVHPQRVESVVWLSERKDVLCAAFYFWSIFFYIKNKKKSALFFFILSMFSKPMAVSLPFVLLLFEIYKNKTFKLKNFSVKLWPYFAILVIFIPITFLTQKEAVNSVIPIYERVLIVFHNIFWYIKQTLLPENLNPLYPPFYYYNSDIYFLAGFSIIFLILSSLLYFKYKLNFFLLISGYLISLAPVSGFIKLGFTDRADRYSYIPSFFIWVGLALLITQINKKTYSKYFKLELILFTLIFLVLSFINYQYQKSWKNLRTLTEEACSNKTVNPLALRMLASEKIKDNSFKAISEISDRFMEINEKYSFNPHFMYNFISACYLKMVIEYHNKNYKKVLYLYNAVEYKINSIDPWYKDMLILCINSSYAAGENTLFNNLITKLLNSPFLSDYEMLYYSGVKADFNRNYRKSLNYFNKALKFEPNDENLLQNIRRLNKKLNEKY